MRPKDTQTVTKVRIIVAAGVLVRLAFLLSSAKHPADPLFVADPYAYLLMAEHAYHGRFFVSFRGYPTSYLSVGYPALVAVARRLVLGILSTWVIALIVNVASFVATAAAMVRLVPVLARRVNLSSRARSAAVTVSVLLLAVYPDFVFATGLVMTELVAVALLSWGLVLVSDVLDRRHAGPRALMSAGGAGLLLGLTVFVRPSMLLLALPVAVVMCAGRHWRGVVVCLGLFAVPLVPLAINNSRVGAGPGITSATWMNVCDGLTNRRGEFEWRRECRVTLLPGQSIGPRTEAENTAWARRISTLYLQHHGLTWAARVPLRIWHSLWSGGWATQYSVHWAQNYVWTLRLRLFLALSKVFFGVVAGVGILQMILLARSRQMVWWPAVTVVLGSLAGVTVSFGQSRFGWPLAVLVFVPYASILLGRLCTPRPAATHIV